MEDAKQLYHGYRFHPTIISHAVWLYHRFCLSFRDVEDLLDERGIAVSYESIRHWCNRFGPEYARKLKKRQGRLGDTWYLDEVFVKICGELNYLWNEARPIIEESGCISSEVDYSKAASITIYSCAISL